jgi:hypothetical protein
MQTFKPAGAELESLRESAALIKSCNSIAAKNEKSVEAAKKSIAEWLKTARSVDLATLPVGEIIIIEDAVMIEIASMSKLDAAALLLAEPELHAKFKKDMAVKKFKPLV